MSFLGNLIWLILGGLLSAIGWFLVGIVWCITIIGIPVGLQCFKIAAMTLTPFNVQVIHDSSTGSFLLNILWLLFGGIELALGHLAWGIILCITIVGIPFGKQHFKLAGLSIRPFGAQLVDS